MKNERIELFLRESNAIEGVYDKESLTQAIKAFRYLKSQDMLTLENILHCHRLLFLRKVKKRFKPSVTFAGMLRDCNVRVGSSVKIPFEEVPNKLGKWILNASPIGVDKQIFVDKGFDYVKKLHIEFENIHPFEDGNGRIGRIILLWQCIKSNIDTPIIRERSKYDYYKWWDNKTEEDKQRDIDRKLGYWFDISGGII